MDWRTVNFDWNRARAFLVSAEEGSYSSAARALKTAQPTIGRQVSALEEELGVVLFERVGSRLVLTPVGADLLEHVRSMREGAARMSLVAAGRSLALEGNVRITASELIAAYLLPPVIARLRREHPGIEIEIVASNAIRDLRRREADIAVRNVKPTQPDLVARKIGDRVAHAYATPEYIARIGSPRTVEELARAEFFGFERVDVMIAYLARLGVRVTERNFPIVTDNHLVQWELAKQGIGICFVMEEVGDAEPRVRRLVPDFPPLPVPIWLVAHRELATSGRMRVVFDALAEELGRSQTQGSRVGSEEGARRGAMKREGGGRGRWRGSG